MKEESKNKRQKLRWKLRQKAKGKSRWPLIVSIEGVFRGSVQTIEIFLTLLNDDGRVDNCIYDMFHCSDIAIMMMKKHCSIGMHSNKKKFETSTKDLIDWAFFIFLCELKRICYNSFWEMMSFHSTRIFLYSPMNMESSGWFNDFLFKVCFLF